MRRPCCSLCDRIGSACVYLARRRAGRRPRNSNPSQKQQSSSTQTEEYAPTHSLEGCLDVQPSPNMNRNATMRGLEQLPNSHITERNDGGASPTSGSGAVESSNFAECSDPESPPRNRDNLGSTCSSANFGQGHDALLDNFFAHTTIPVPQESEFPDFMELFDERRRGSHISEFDSLNIPPTDTEPIEINTPRNLSIQSPKDTGSPCLLAQQKCPLLSLSVSPAIADEL